MADELDVGAPAAPNAPPAEQTYEVTVAGQAQQVPLSELLKGYSRTSDYTRKTQLLAEQHRGFQERETQYQQALIEARDLLTNKEALVAHLKTLGYTPQEANRAADQVSPDDLLTHGQVQKLLEERERKLQESTQHQLDTVQQSWEERQLTTQYKGLIDQKIAEIAAKYPELPKFPGLDQTMKDVVKQQKPTSVNQALLMLDELADYYASQLGEIWKSRGGVSPQVAGIEPPRGAAPMPAGQDETYSSVSDPRLHDRVVADLERLMSR